MFSRARQTRSEERALVVARERQEAAPASAGVPSVVAADLHIVGNLASSGELHIDGEVQGDVQATTLVIGETGQVSGEVEAEELVVQGAVEGTIRARKVHLQQTCRVAADIVHDILSIDEGASFEGQCRRSVEPFALQESGEVAPEEELPAAE